ncbi:hypothetical protein M440DRAFT_1082000 [Trichoderma longibrachiatum ATCC 18648]|uniref:Uncharacterized protein n=1 Tax=Trichoderma longibrachiatum ATCC 18648 TaxID=983965 RepID=A0A2T4BTU9_TRILO|nr:hypothetical protein M440DRAFT_1082000 [Trichoderma longibrachiatum ATCC 18648]
MIYGDDRNCLYNIHDPNFKQIGGLKTSGFRLDAISNERPDNAWTTQPLAKATWSR